MALASIIEFTSTVTFFAGLLLPTLLPFQPPPIKTLPPENSPVTSMKLSERLISLPNISTYPPVSPGFFPEASTIPLTFILLESPADKIITPFFCSIEVASTKPLVFTISCIKASTAFAVSIIRPPFAESLPKFSTPF